MRLVWHFLKRTFRYNAPLSAVGAMLPWTVHPRAGNTTLAEAATELAIRFVIIACTAGYALSVLVYFRLNRRELPMYTVRGRHLGWMAAVSLAPLSLALGGLLVAGLLLIGWTGP
jgi:hypothetical protein